MNNPDARSGVSPDMSFWNSVLAECPESRYLDSRQKIAGMTKRSKSRSINPTFIYKELIYSTKSPIKVFGVTSFIFTFTKSPTFFPFLGNTTILLPSLRPII